MDREFFSSTLTGGDKLKINGLKSTNCLNKCNDKQFCSLDNTYQEFCDSCDKFATPTDCKERGLPSTIPSLGKNACLKQCFNYEMPEPNLIFSAICQQDMVNFEAFGQSKLVAKNDFGFIVIITDFFVIILYLYFVKYLSGV